jgi:hypothetical protein
LINPPVIVRPYFVALIVTGKNAADGLEHNADDGQSDAKLE